MTRNSDRWLDLLGLATLVFIVVGLYMAFLYAQTEVNMGLVYRIFFFHFGAIAAGMVAVIIVGVASVGYLRTSARAWDRVAEAAAEIGVVFSIVGLITGSIWARPIWGVWWTWDPRLTTTAVLLLIYLGYLAIRRISDNPMRTARWCAVVGIVGFVDVPIVHLSVVWWRSLHQGPTVIRLGGPEIHGTMLLALLVWVGAFTLVYAYLMTLRLRVGRLEERAAREALSPLIGSLVEAEP